MIKLGDFLDFWVKQLSKKIFSAEAVFLRVLIKEATNFLAHEGYFSVDKLFNFDKCIFDLHHKRNPLLILLFRNIVFFVELKIFLLELSELIVKVFVEKKGRDFVMVFALFFHMELAVVNYFSYKFNQPLDAQKEILVIGQGFIRHFQVFHFVAL
jgi:hypothetical protein